MQFAWQPPPPEVPPEPEPLPQEDVPPVPMVPEAEHLSIVQQTREQAYAEGQLPVMRLVWRRPPKSGSSVWMTTWVERARR